MYTLYSVSECSRLYLLFHTLSYVLYFTCNFMCKIFTIIIEIHGRLSFARFLLFFCVQSRSLVFGHVFWSAKIF